MHADCVCSISKILVILREATETETEGLVNIISRSINRIGCSGYFISKYRMAANNDTSLTNYPTTDICLFSIVELSKRSGGVHARL